MSWLLETLAWTAALIVLVLVLRRPVARSLGAKAAYALWLLPFARLLLPPIVLPAWLAPSPEPIVDQLPQATYVVVDSAVPAASAATEVATQAVQAAPSPFPWVAALLAVWLAGAALFLILRFSAYFRMRRELLVDAHPVGEAGRVRLVESPATTGPVAFGVLDKVVALPLGFMAHHDRPARDLALAHELAHHRGHDLLANFAAQPLFALHWFNPLGYAGWQAMRRDQEAACDARVVETSDRATRAAYGQVIASFATGPRVALAAPMACPVLGDKSIIHRLRSLTMTDITPRRRIAGRALLAAGLLALPLTASVTYAESIVAPEPPQPPAAPAAPEAPEAPLAPVAALAPEAPVPPAPPAPPAVPAAPKAGSSQSVWEWNTDGKHGRHEARRVIRNGEPTFMVDGKEMDEEEFEKRMEEFGARTEKSGRDLEIALADMPKMDEKQIRIIEKRAREAAAMAPEVRNSCEGEGMTSETTLPNGKKVIRICEKRIVANAQAGARAGLARARAEIARNRAMSEEVRAEVMRELDAEIARMDAGDDD